ncbi:hypothetical protein FOMA001_g12 [Fusarium oxysporum f. sp. matthiolae]|nr:hypothetical protein FOMA001_g12 [Fusarium oxysporum f. sp. matthiolae]
MFERSVTVSLHDGSERLIDYDLSVAADGTHSKL